MREIKNACIVGTTLGVGDHGVWTLIVEVAYDGCRQGFGGYVLDHWNEAIKERIGTAYGMQFIMEVCKIAGVERWEDLPGKYVRTDADSTKIYRIGHITADRWFDPAALIETDAAKSSGLYCPKDNALLTRLRDSSEPEGIRPDAKCLQCKRVFMVTKSHLIEMRG